jgi:methylthioribose-1-phosphate isomerase
MSMNTSITEEVVSLRWNADHLELLDQRLLPEEVHYLDLTRAEEVWEAINHLKVRGAPAIGIAAAYGVHLAAERFLENKPNASLRELVAEINRQSDYLATSRPTAVNLFWALDRMKLRAAKWAAAPDAMHKATSSLSQSLLVEAQQIQAEDEETCRMIGEHALTLFEDGMGVLTHCNAGGLATAKYGTALSPFYLALEKGIALKVFADETRPVLQGARLTAFELQRAGVDVTLICDNMAGMVMSKGWIQAVIVGTDRVAANGDVANKIGTYSVAVLAKAHHIPFYVACPLSTIDLSTAEGNLIPIEERHADEITQGFGKRTAPQGIKIYNPAFDITPHEYVTAIITEKGIIRPSYVENLPKLFN